MWEAGHGYHSGVWFAAEPQRAPLMALGLLMPTPTLGVLIQQANQRPEIADPRTDPWSQGSAPGGPTPPWRSWTSWLSLASPQALAGALR